MSQGSKTTYTAKQKAKARHIEESYQQKGVAAEKAEAIAWATVNKQSGGGEAGGSGTDKTEAAKASARKISARRATATKQGLSRKESLGLETKTTLLKQARELNIPGRSSMTKQELLAAIKSH